MSVSDPPEFGPNGSVLNSKNVSPELEQKYRDADSGDVGLNPKLWPLSALILAMLGVFLWGIRIGSDESSIPIALPLAVVFSGIVWRDVWSRYFRR